MNSEDPLNLLTLPEPPIIEEVEVNTVGLEVELLSDSSSVGGDGEIDNKSKKEAESEVKDSKVPSEIASEDKNAAVGRIQGKEVDGDSFEVPAPPPVSRSLTPPLIKAGPSTSSPTTRLYSPHHKSKKELEEEDERERMQLLVSNFSEGQYDRYEMFRRSTFPKAAIKRIMQTITGNAVSQNVVIAMSGIAKVFVGEVVEEGLDAMERMGDTGPLRPKHLRESVRRLRNERCSIPRSNTKKFNPFSL